MAPILARALNRLTREAICDLVLSSWLQQNHTSAPYLLCNRTDFEAEEEDYLHTPAESVEQLRRLYRALKEDNTGKSKRDVIDRIVDGDWRRGLSLEQHATLDFAYLEEHDTALKWSALKLVALEAEGQRLSHDEVSNTSSKKRKLSHDSETAYPQVSAQAFLSALKAEISPLVKAHYHLHRMPAPYHLTILRLYISPHTAFAPTRSKVPRRARHAADSGRIMYIALPDSCPYVYISITGSSSSSSGRSKGVNSTRDAKAKAMAKIDMASMKRIVLQAIPKAFSRPQQRWALESTKLVAKSLKTICELRGNQKPGTGGGAYSIFAASDTSSDKSPVDVQIAYSGVLQVDDARQRQIEERFGSMNGEHVAALDRVHVKLTRVLTTGESTTEEDEDSRLSNEKEEPGGEIHLTFSGSNVFDGLKTLAQLGPEHIDLDKVPAWITGELGMSNIAA